LTDANDAPTREGAPGPLQPPRASLGDRLVGGGTWVFVGKAVTGVSSLIVNAMIARLLTLEDVGVFNLAFSIAMFSSMLAHLGMSRAVVRLVAETMGTNQPGRARSAIRIVFAFGIAGSAVTLVLLAFGVGPWIARVAFDKPLLLPLMGGVGVWAAMLGLQTLISETFRGFQNLKMAVIFGGVISGLLSAAVFSVGWFVWSSLTLEVVLAVTVASLSVNLLIAAFAMRRQVLYLGPAAPMKVREVTDIAWPLLVTGLLAHALMQADIWILGAFGTETELGIYGMTARLVRLVAIPLMIVNLLVPPFVAELFFTGKREQLQRVLRGTATLAGIPAVFVLAVFILFGGPILGGIYGEEYRQGATVMMILSIGRLVHVWTGSGQAVLAMTGHQSALMRITLISSTITVAGQYLAVEPFGMTGVAMATSGGVVLHNLVIWVTARKLTGLWTNAGVPSRKDTEELLRRFRLCR
jgi:O-antigen/teichoic acid export membrane protein